MTRSAAELAACLREIADMLDAADLGELACPARVRVSIDGPSVGAATERLALVDQVAAVTGNSPVWDRRSGGEYAWYETVLEDRAMVPWSLFCNAYVKHPFGDLRTENDALRARLAEIEGIASGAKALPAAPAQTAPDVIDGSPFDLDVPILDPAEFDGVHERVGGRAGGPGDCAAWCACGVTFDGFDTIAEAGALVDEHAANANAGPAPSTPDGGDQS